MNKVNLCWVLSDGKRGHEIQSMTLAKAISEQVKLHRFNLRQPWQTFAPRRLPKFSLATDWLNHQPDFSTIPQLLITTGRRAAAVGKHIRAKVMKLNYNCHHIQILNPKDNLNKYSLVLIPNHDQVIGENVINFVGNIHPYGPQLFINHEKRLSEYITLLLGNPPLNYFNQNFAIEINKIRKSFPDSPLYFCGSPRLQKSAIKIVKSHCQENDLNWFKPSDGDNPYRALLTRSKKIFVTSDSINMINESCQSSAPVTLLAAEYCPTPKHQIFIKSILSRLCDFDSMDPGLSTEYALETIVNDTKLNLLLKKL